jgi:hypothetical protein
MYYEEPQARVARITFSSILLLIIFISAFALILAAVIWRPWFEEDESPVVQAPSADEQVPAEAEAAPDGAAAGDAPAEAPAGP